MYVQIDGSCTCKGAPVDPGRHNLHRPSPLPKAINLSFTGAFLYVYYSFLLISNKFCDSSLLHWPLFSAV